MRKTPLKYEINVGLCVATSSPVRPDVDWCYVGHVTINTLLPDDVLLDIFDIYRGDDECFATGIWKPLIHVCRRWRSIIFASPRRLHLVLECDARTSVSKLLDTWPPLPITIRCSPKDDVEEDITAALELRDRISGISFDRIENSDELERFMFMMQQPFPALTRFHFAFHYDYQALVHLWLGFSPHWQPPSFNSLKTIFVGFPKFFSSATCLTTLSLLGLPSAQHYFSPDMMVTYLATLPILKEFSVGFSETRPDPSPPTNPPSQTPVVLPALTFFRFSGVSEYLEDFVARIDTPLLDNIHIVFFKHDIFHVQQLCGLIIRSETSKPLEQAHIQVEPYCKITLGSPTRPSRFFLEIGCYTRPWRVSLMAQLCNGLSPLLSHVERLEVCGNPYTASASPGDIESAQWLKLFRPFTAVQSLHVSKLIVPLVAPVLQGPNVSGEGHTDALPALRELVLEGL